ncbi:MAG: hypothetical protein F6K08_20320 [Okeania sp. SIO1H6]|nr:MULTISPECIES: hypothetical protein [unclassified Okeania]NEP04662.1 hypothetical protein [Okeania sp. SIO4D6]NEP92226.1 hypothetical protein [Okeania sp. SIO2F5]NEQ71775.1 hypothetical protein [Okeania sp. SIO2C9]NET15005.1 hypothetical protein [Okeania sp. SIO1H6]
MENISNKMRRQRKIFGNWSKSQLTHKKKRCLIINLRSPLSQNQIRKPHT